MTPHIATGTNSFRSVRPLEAPPARVVVHIVDADDRVQLALRRSLADSGFELQVHAQLADFLGAQCAAQPACLIIDVQSFGAGPVPCSIRCPVILTACSGDLALVVRAMKAGAVDVVEKPLCDQKLADAVAEAIEIDRQRRVVESHHASVHARFAMLTPRERQVMALVTAGKLNKLVAADLSLSEITVKAHRGSVMRKMGARSLADLVRMADIVGGTLKSIPINDNLLASRHGADANLPTHSRRGPHP
jgi:FixJ family two-component response regulator